MAHVYEQGSFEFEEVGRDPRGARSMSFSIFSMEQTGARRDFEISSHESTLRICGFQLRPPLPLPPSPPHKRGRPRREKIRRGCASRSPPEPAGGV